MVEAAYGLRYGGARTGRAPDRALGEPYAKLWGQIDAEIRARDEVREICADGNWETGDGEDVYLSDGVWLSWAGKLKKKAGLIAASLGQGHKDIHASRCFY